MGCGCGKKKAVAADPVEVFTTTETGGFDVLATAFRSLFISTPTLSREVSSGATVRLPKLEADSLIAQGAGMRIIHVYLV